MQLSATVSSVTSSVSNSFNTAKLAAVNLFNPTVPQLDIIAMTKAAKAGHSFLRNTLMVDAVNDRNTIEVEFPTHAMIDGVMTDITNFPRTEVLQGDALIAAVKDLANKVKGD